MWFNQSNQKNQNRDTDNSHQESVDSVPMARTYISIAWIQDSSNQINSHSISDAVKALDGVKEVHFTFKDPTILIIDFAPDETRAKILQEEICDLGMMAKIIKFEDPVAKSPQYGYA